MKKLLAALFCILMMSGATFADELSYEIDPLATAKAPWKVREKIIEDGHCMGEGFHREFLGVAQSGLAVLQDFYPSGEKFSDSFFMPVLNVNKNTEGACLKYIEGVYTSRYKSGQKQGEVNFKNGKAEGLITEWHENGQKKREGHVKNAQEVGIWRAWDKEGSLIKEQDFGEFISFVEEQSYDIDPVATANAPWKVGERIVEEGNCEGEKYDREFLGMTQSGLAAVQDFYSSGEKLSNPILMRVTTTEKDMDESCMKAIEGRYTLLYKSGQKKAAANLENGQVEGLVTIWYENGQKQMDMRFKTGKEVGIWRTWSKDGVLLDERDYGTPKN